MPAIARADAAAERMRGHVEPAGVEVEADRGGRRLAEDAAAIDRVIALQDLAPRLAAPRRRWLRPAAPAPGAGRRTTSVISRGRRAGFVFVEQGVVGRVLVADGLRLLRA